MKDTFKKFMTVAMLLSFSLTTPVSALAAASGDLLAYSADYMPEIRGSQPSIVSLDSQNGITNKNININLSLRDSDVKQVLRMFADKAGLNIIFKGDVKGNVTMDLVNMPLNSAFNMVMTSQDLTYTLKDKTLLITSAEDAAAIAKHEMAVIPVKYLNAAQIAHFLNANIYGMNKPGLSNTYIASVNPATNEVIIFGSDNDVKLARTVIAQFDKKPTVTSFKVNHTTPAQMADMVCTLLLPGTGAFMPSGSSSGSAANITGGAADLYTNAARGLMTGAASSSSSDSNIELGAGKIACASAIVNEGKKKSSSSSSRGDKKSEESEVVSFQTFGITVAYYTQLGTISITGATPHQIDMVKEFIAQNDKRQPQAYIEFSIIELSEDGSREFNNEWSFVSKHLNMNFSGGAMDGKTDVNPYFNNANYITGTPALLYSLQMIMQNKKGRTISNPRIVVTNGQESVIDLTEDYIKTVTSQVVQGSYSNVPTVERTYETGDDMGLKISVTPFISPDGFVYLNVKPEYATEKEKVYSQNELGQQDLAATLLRKSNLELKNIRVKDEDTLIIGGMMKEAETKYQSKVPFLGDIPGIGTFFRSSKTEKAKSELIILITPKIISDSDETSTSL